jgi:multiple sugar transport system permease protein
VIPTPGHAARERHAVLVLPAALLLLLIVGYPIVRVLVLASIECGLATGFQMRWHGLNSWRALLADSRYMSALVNTALFTLISVALEGILGLAVALLLARPFRGRGHVRALMMLPWTMPTAVMALAWTFILNVSFGVL